MASRVKPATDFCEDPRHKRTCTSPKCMFCGKSPLDCGCYEENLERGRFTHIFACGIYLKAQRDSDVDPKLEVSFDTNVRAHDLRCATPGIMRWQHGLIQRYGLVRAGGDYARALHRRYQWAKSAGDRDLTWPKLRDETNEAIAASLRRYVEDQRRWDRAKGEHPALSPRELWHLITAECAEEGTRWQGEYGLAKANTILRDLLVPESEAEEWVSDAIENIRGGVEPFPPGSPIDLDQLRQATRPRRTTRK